MKSIIFICLLLVGLKVSAQNPTRSDLDNFRILMNIKRHINDFAKASAYVEMRSSLYKVYGREPSETEVRLAFDEFGHNEAIYDNYFYSVLISVNGNTEFAERVLYSYCENMQLSIKLITYIKNKFRKQFISYLASRSKEKDNNGNEGAMQKIKIETQILDPTFLYSSKYDIMRVVKEDDLTIKPKLLNIDSLTIGLNNSYLHDVEYPFKKKYQSINAKVLLIIDKLGNVEKMINIEPTKSFETVENIFESVNLSFIQNLKFSPGKKNSNSVNCEFHLNVEVYFSAHDGIIKKTKSGLTTLNIKVSKSESELFYIRNDDEIYAPLLKLTKNKIEPSHIYYLETDEQADSLEIFTPKKIIACGFVKR